MKLKTIACLALAALLVSPAVGADEKKAARKGKKNARQNVATTLLKRLGDIGLTEEQTKQMQELGKKAAAEMKAIRDEAGITTDVMKKLGDAQKSLKDSDKKGKERMAAAHEAAGLTEAQVAAMAKVTGVRTQLQKDMMALLTDEQKEKLPEQMQRAAKRDSAKGKGKKKKDAA